MQIWLTNRPFSWGSKLAPSQRVCIARLALRITQLSANKTPRMITRRGEKCWLLAGEWLNGMGLVFVMGYWLL
jgi:hypothetical protein